MMIEYAVLRLRQALQSLFGFGVTVTCHLAYLDPGPEPEVTKPPQEGVPFAPVATIGPKKPKRVLCITVANTGWFPVTVTNVYFGGGLSSLPTRPVLNPARPVPHWLEAGRVWETWAEVPPTVRGREWGRVRRTIRVTATGRLYAAKERKHVPPAGVIPA
jgi:hypothetical protein